MSDITESLVTMLHTDPEVFEDVPSDSEIIESNPDLKKSGRESLTPGERQGFLEMWRMGRFQTEIATMSPADLEQVVTDYDTQADEFRALQERIFDIRFIANAARSQLMQQGSPSREVLIIQDVKEI